VFLGYVGIFIFVGMAFFDGDDGWAIMGSGDAENAYSTVLGGCALR
jgi:hypothetical protein